MADNLATSLLEKLQNLIAYLDSESFALNQELHKSPEAQKTKADLFQLERSLDQYVRSDRSLRHVAFVGHYSAGKSSTINSLLETKSREVDLHPTDTGITYLAATKNGKKVLSARSSGTLDVKVSLFDHPLLDDIVLIDTPGTADPSQLGAMVRDILPVSTFIVYLVNATNPFDESDVPTFKLT